MYCKLSSGLKILKFSKYSSYFFVYSVANADEFTVIYPLSSPAQSCTLRDTMCFRGFYQRLMCKLGLERREEELLLAGGLDGRYEFGGVVGVGAEQILEPDVSSTQQRRRTRIRFGTNRRRLLSGTALRAQLHMFAFKWAGGREKFVPIYCISSQRCHTA